MNATLPSSSSCRLLAIFTLFLACFALTAGCEQWSVHTLEELALQPLSKQESRQLTVDLARLSRDDHTPQSAERAAAILERANIDAATSPLARSTQAAAIGRLLASESTEQDATWQPPEIHPALVAPLQEVFFQADERLRTSSPDLMTVMVWAETGTALGRPEHIHAMLERAKTDDRLRQLLRQDDPTRRRLYAFATAHPSDWWREVSGVVWRQRVPSQSEQFGDEVEDIVLLPARAAVFIGWVLCGAPVL